MGEKFPSAAHLAARVDKLASIPEAITRILGEIDDHRSTAVSIAVSIKRDPPLAARVLRLANSGLFSRGAKVTEIANAVSRLGLNEIRNIVTTTALASAFHLGSGTGVGLFELYQHALTTAALSQVVARRATLPAEGPHRKSAFTAGLLHDVGLFVLHSFASDAIDDTLQLAHSSARPYYEVEHELFGYNHTDTGAMVLQRWRLSPAEVEVSRWHHQPDGAPVEYQPLVHVVCVASALTSRLYQEGDLKTLTEIEHSKSMRYLQIDANMREQLLTDVQDATENAKALLKSLK